MKTRLIGLLLGFGVILGMGVFSWILFNRGSTTSPDIAPVETQQPPVEVHVPSPSVESVSRDAPTLPKPGEESPALSPNVDSGERDSSTEILGSWRSYEAHASLREPAVFDPDSPENIRIMESMISKALIRTAMNPATTPSN